MSADHTPGPWFDYTEPHGTRHILPCRVPTLNTVQICMFGGTAYRSKIETDANARLLAAAPELLAALIGMMNRYGDKSPHPTCDASISARAAIVKAGGTK